MILSKFAIAGDCSIHKCTRENSPPSPLSLFAIIPSLSLGQINFSENSYVCQYMTIVTTSNPQAAINRASCYTTRAQGFFGLAAFFSWAEQN